MMTSHITIENGRVVVTPAPDGTVWMTQHEIADTFGVFVSAVGVNIRSIFKNGILREDRVRHEIHHKSGSIATLYNLEMVVALAFRFKSWQADTFRRWLMERATRPEQNSHALPPISVFVPMGGNTLPN